MFFVSWCLLPFLAFYPFPSDLQNNLLSSLPPPKQNGPKGRDIKGSQKTQNDKADRESHADSFSWLQSGISRLNIENVLFFQATKKEVRVQNWTTDILR